MYDFFLSHSKTIKESIAIPIAQYLSKIGFSTWIDRKVISVGDLIYDDIRKALSKVKYGIAIIDSSYLRSEWTIQELNLLHEREIVEKRILIIPIFVSIEKIDVYKVIPWLDGRAFEKVNNGFFNISQNLGCFSRIIARFYNDNISINSLDTIIPILSNRQFPCKNALIELIKAKYYYSSDLRLAIIELCNIQGLIYAIYTNLGKESKSIQTANYFSKLLQNFCYNDSYNLDYNVYSSFYKSVLSSATELINMLNIL